MHLSVFISLKSYCNMLTLNKAKWMKKGFLCRLFLAAGGELIISAHTGYFLGTGDWSEMIQMH